MKTKQVAYGPSRSYKPGILQMRSPASPPVVAYNICPIHPVGIDGAHEEEDLDEDLSPQIILPIEILESNGRGNTERGKPAVTSAAACQILKGDKYLALENKIIPDKRRPK